MAYVIQRMLVRAGRWRFLHIVAMATFITLVLQFLMIYKNKCWFITNRTDLKVRGLPDVIMELPVAADEKPVYKPLTRRVDSASPQPSRKRRLAIGIPTIRRPNKNYFIAMLSDMFNKTSEDELKNIVFVVFLADLGTISWKSAIESEIRSNYSKHIETGSLKVIQAPVEFYRSMPTIKNDTYTNWRTKQNFDYAFIMKYCEHLSDFYMQMEDDVTAVTGYYSAIFDFVKVHSDEPWVCLEFSSLGFIGKLYHSTDIGKLADMLLMFNSSQPVDYTFVYYNMLTGKQTHLRKPSLFQHMGYYSSLDKKLQPLKDKFFDFPAKEFHGDNPSASVQTTFKYSPDFPPELAYSENPGFFWSVEGADINSKFTVVFSTAHRLKQIIVRTGLSSHPRDFVQHAILEASDERTENAEKSECGEFVEMALFQEGNVAVDHSTISSRLGEQLVKCLQIRFLDRQTEWVIIKEIAVFVNAL